MTDPFSAAASGITVITLAAQLAVSVAKLYDFWKSVQDAPKAVRSLTADLELFKSILDEIQRVLLLRHPEILWRLLSLYFSNTHSFTNKTP
jgi:hypothetical protein